MDRIKWLKEGIGGLVKKQEELVSTLETEKRARNEEETRNWNSWNEEKRQFQEELDDLEKLEKEQAKKAQEEQRKFTPTMAKDKKEDKAPEVSPEQKHLQSEEARNAKVFKALNAMFNEDREEMRSAMKQLAEGGHYDDLLGGAEHREGFNTLVDKKGGILVPTSISSSIMDIGRDYGVIPKLAMNFGNIIQGTIRVPNILTEFSAFTAVNQGSAIPGDSFDLGGLELKALKWGKITDWTNEIDESVGGIIINAVNRKIGEAWAKTLDTNFINADGTSAYHSIKGIDHLAGTVNYVQSAIAATGGTSFSALKADDFLKPQEVVVPGIRATGGVYLMHPNMIFTLRKLKDNQGKYIYGDPSEVAPIGTLWGVPIETTEEFPWIDGTSKTVCAYFNPNYVAYATGRSLTATRLTEATIKNSDNKDVNLATMDAQALRFTGLFDLKLSNMTRSVGNSTYGAFSVLKTASS